METKSNSAVESPRLGNIAPPPPAGKHRKKILMGGVIGLVLLAVGIFYYLHFLAPYVSTDDAFIDGYVTMISSRVPGQVSRLLVTDNQWVKEGDDSRPLRRAYCSSPAIAL